MLKHNDFLSSWKEIAQYLECGERTCRRWEKEHELPIHRIKGTSRSRVCAYKEELDDWQKARKSSALRQTAKSALSKLRKKVIYIILPACIVFVCFIIIYKRISALPEPFDFKIQQSTLVILGKKGKELWRFDTKVKNLKDEEYYRRHFQIRQIPNKTEVQAIRFPHLKFIDLNNDGFLEVLFSVSTEDEYGSDKFYCFGKNGKEIWTFTVERKIQFGKEIFADFKIIGFDANDFNGDGSYEIVIFSNAVLRYPSPLYVLNNKGIELGEYWNSGQYNDYGVADLNKDGNEELVVVGVNNEYKTAFMMVLNPFNLHGGSPQKSASYASNEVGPGSQFYYMLFPRSDVSKVLSILEGTKRLRIISNPGFYVTMKYSELMFELDFDLNLIRVIPGTRFQLNHKILKSEGKIYSILNDEYINNLAQKLLYFNGVEWVSNSAMSNPWSSGSHKKSTNTAISIPICWK